MSSTIGEVKRKAARCLFGRPDPGEVTQKLNNSLGKMYEVDSRKWNFDFAGGVPIVGAEGEYDFESVSASEVPQFYHEKTMRARKTVARRNLSPISDTVEVPDEPLFLVEQNAPLSVASTSKEVSSYEKPVTRSCSAKKTNEQKEADSLKQTKLTNYMPVRKRRSETNLVGSAVSLNRSVSIDTSIMVPKEKRGNKLVNNNKGAPKRPLRFVLPNLPKSAQSSVSDSALVSSPRSPPPKKGATTRRSRRPVEAGDF